MNTSLTMRRPLTRNSTVSDGGINPAAIFSVLVAVAGALVSTNPLLSLVGLAGLILLVKSFWTRSQPAIIFWALLHQWLQVNILLIYGNFTGQDQSALLYYKEHAEQAYLLSMAGLIAVGLGYWVLTRHLLQENIDRWLDQLEPRKCLKTYLTFVVVSFIISSLNLPGIGQLLLVISLLKWGFFYIFFSAVFHTGRYRGILVFCMLLEFIFSLYSIFAGFKAILLMPIVLLPVFMKKRFSLINLLLGVIAAVALINVGIVWTAVKQDYRSFLSSGLQGQVIVVDRNRAMTELGRLVSSMNGQRYQQAAVAMISRISYIDFLSGVIGNVPARLPHENGAIALKAFTHVVTPRILFPEKEALHDSLHLNKYVGKYTADYRTTSMSIGYVGDLYIDFGFFAPFALFGVGLLFGFMYRLLYRQDADAGWGIFMVMPMFFIIYLFEISLIKQVGVLVTCTLLMLAVSKFMLPQIKRSTVRGSISSGTTLTVHVNPRRARLSSGKRPQWT